MKTRRSFVHAAAFALAVLFASPAIGPAAAQLPPPPGPVAQCLEECVSLRLACAHACHSSFIDCMRGARLEMRICRGDCAAQFEKETPEFESCVGTCRDEILVPAREECAAQRVECAPLCSPGPCLRICRPGGDELDEVDECRAACAGELRACARQGKVELHECLMPCRELTDEVEREACVDSCAEAARNGAAACLEEMRSCSAGCEEPTTTTTTLPES